ncbi:MAG: rod shape-determining protein MreC [Desulfobacteraceae bacterium]|nr:rod shape-determining protein MreC [Desulfobacteraceae bacterium]
MFSKKMLVFMGVLLFIAVNFTVITMTSRQSLPVSSLERIAISLTSPFQLLVSKTMGFTESVWKTYFMSVLAVQENTELKVRLSRAMEIQNRYAELEQENSRLKKLVDFTSSVPDIYVAAQVIARDPSPWFKTIMIDKGKVDGVIKGSPVLVSEGIVGQIIQVSNSSSKVLLITDRNSAVDALVQDTRVRGMIKGNNKDQCIFVYALRKDEIKAGEMIVSSGLDQVFPKGLKIGRILDVENTHSQLFQNITVETSVNFDKLEDVLVFINAK